MGDRPDQSGSKGSAPEPPKIHIDSDWKSQAQAERERLAQSEAEKKARDAEEGGEEEMPPASFRTLMGMLASQALMYMGGIADPQSGRPIFDPTYAVHMIELLGVLEEKTKGNLSDEESKELMGVLHELRSRYVQLMQVVAQQQAQQGMPKGGGGGQPGGGVGGSGLITP
ncbi:MAG: DUF1844 domain-containing protein [Phycisphaerales bacterium]